MSTAPIFASDYSDGTYTKFVNYGTNASGSWQTETVYGLSGDSYITNVFITLGSSGNAHIGFVNWSDNALMYATNAPGSWSGVTVEYAVTIGPLGSMAIDSAGKAHISYYDSWPARDLRYASNRSGSWRTEVVESAGEVGELSSLVVDSSGNVHIAYFDTTNGSLKYATDRSTGQAALTISKTASPLAVAAGSDITYTLSYANDGDVAAAGVVITDTIPDGTSFVSASDAGLESGGVVTWDIGTLDAGSTGQVSFTVNVGSAIGEGAAISNADYSIDSDQTDAVTGNAVNTIVIIKGTWMVTAS